MKKYEKQIEDEKQVFKKSISLSLQWAVVEERKIVFRVTGWKLQFSLTALKTP